MSTVTFEPKGEVAEWRVLFDHLSTLKVGDLVTYDELSTLLGRDFLVARGPFHQANQRLLAAHKRGMVNVRNTGYRVVAAVEHEDVARDQHRFAKRRLRKSKHWLANTNREELPPEVVERFDQLEQTLDRQIDFTRRLDRRVAKVEKALEASRSELAGQATATDDRVSKLVEALARHGITIDA